jgi:hypothetical protein
MVRVLYRETTKAGPLVISCQYAYYKKAPQKASIRYTCRECNASVTIENGTNTIIKVNGRRIRVANNLEDEIKRSHEDCEKMDDDQLLAFDSVNR